MNTNRRWIKNWWVYFSCTSFSESWSSWCEKYDITNLRHFLIC